MTAEKNSNNRGWRSIQAILLIVTLGFLFVDKIVLPAVGSGKLADMVQAQAQDIAVLKDVVFTLRYLPAEVSGIKATLKGVETTVDRIEGNLKDHINKR